MTRTIYIANFGEGNSEWPRCRNTNVIAVVDSEEEYQAWLERDREAYSRLAQQRGATGAVATRWFNINDIFSETVTDIWLHREGDALWWTISNGTPLERIEDVAPGGLIVLVKSCHEWRNTTIPGQIMSWSRLDQEKRGLLDLRGNTLREVNERIRTDLLRLILGNTNDALDEGALWDLVLDRLDEPGIELGERQAEARSENLEIESEIAKAMQSPTYRGIQSLIDRDLEGALEGQPDERKQQLRRRAAWVADNFVKTRIQSHTLKCDDCSFDPSSILSGLIQPRTLLDVHHKNPLYEGLRRTNNEDFALLCPTCHRIEHARLRLQKK